MDIDVRTVVGILSIPSTELVAGTFVDIHPPEGQVYLLTIGVISGLNGACVVSIRDVTGGMDIFQAPAGPKNAGGFVTANAQSWIRINNVDFGGIASYAVSGIILNVAADIPITI